MTLTSRLNIPHQITDFDDRMLVLLSKNFSEIQRHVARTQMRVKELEDRVQTIETWIEAQETP